MTNSELREFVALIEQHEEQQRIRYCGDLRERLQHVLGQYEHLATNALVGAKGFRDDVVVMLRAMSMILEMVANASTHAEKAARLRGCVELIESAISKLRKEQFDFSHSFYFMEDVFRSDFPTRELMRRIHGLEEELRRVKGEQCPAST